MSEYRVPENWMPQYSRSFSLGDFEGDPMVETGILIGWLTPEGFVSPDKLPKEYKPEPRTLDADGSGRLLPTTPPADRLIGKIVNAHQDTIDDIKAKLQAAEARAEKVETRLAEEQRLRTDHGIYFDSLHEMLAGYGTDSDPLDKRVSALLERVEKAEKH